MVENLSQTDLQGMIAACQAELTKRQAAPPEASKGWSVCVGSKQVEAGAQAHQVRLGDTPMDPDDVPNEIRALQAKGLRGTLTLTF